MPADARLTLARLSYTMPDWATRLIRYINNQGSAQGPTPFIEYKT